MDENPEVVTVAATREDGGLTVSRFIITREHPVITPEWINEIYTRKARDTGKVVVSWEVVPNDYLNDDTDNTYRNAWKHNAGGRKPDHDMPKAREIHRVHLRRARLAEFDRLDNDYRMADEAADVQAKKEIAVIRQKFRDVTEDSRIETAKTVEELKALRLDVLVPETLGVKATEKMKISPAIPGVAEKDK
jgi:hypothetical protein